MPYLDFQVNQVLTAAQVNSYLMNQSVMTFADAAARTTALPTPNNGMMSFQEDVLQVQVYSGAVLGWTAITGGGGGGFETNFLLMGA
mgnify:FL=1|jgi:hypothetical protein|tara:strand:- start:29 stop:289 length:261 start_codon:yes stop_codon:yes gene_type:complete